MVKTLSALPMQGPWAQYLVGELRSHMPHGQKKILKVSVSHGMGELSFYNGVINFPMNEQFLLVSLLSFFFFYACVFAFYSHAVWGALNVLSQLDFVQRP